MKKIITRPIRLRFETIGTITAMIVGICALFITWDQSQTLRRQTEAAVMPILQSKLSYNTEKDQQVVQYQVNNYGNGAAIIQSATFLIDDEPVQKLSDLIENGFPEPLNTARVRFGGSLQITGVLAAGETNPLLWISWLDDMGNEFRSYRRKVFFKEVKKLDLEICYCSIHQQCWITRSEENNLPQNIKTCPVTEVDPVQSLISDKDFFKN